jgi:hypothetical protein
MIDRAKEVLRRSFVYALYQKYQVWQWRSHNKPGPPPHRVKQEALLEYRKKYGVNVFVETGTYRGDMVEVLRKVMKEAWSIEVNHELCLKAQRRFAADPRVHIVEGDSGEVLSGMLAGISERCLFWLDGHYSMGVTGRGAEDCPIRRELASIFAHKVPDHVILIDDARCFRGCDGYPTIEEIRGIVETNRPGWSCDIADDIIRIHAAPE